MLFAASPVNREMPPAVAVKCYVPLVTSIVAKSHIIAEGNIISAATSFAEGKHH